MMLWAKVLQGYERGYRVSVYLPILYAFTLSATIRIIFFQYEDIPFETLGSPRYVYILWCYLGISSSVSFFCSWIMIHKGSGKWTYSGLWIMLGANVSQLLYLLSFHLTILMFRPAAHQHVMTDERVMQRYLVGSIMIYLIILIIKDIAWLVTTEREAVRIYNASK